jgi:hypothetical protein
MTAQTTGGRSSLGFLVVIILGLLLIAVPVLSKHAIDGHGRAAISSYNRVSNYDPDEDPESGKRLFDEICPDGRRYIMLRLPKLSSKSIAWAVYIGGGKGGTEYNVTAYITRNRNWVQSKKDWCQ